MKTRIKVTGLICIFASMIMAFRFGDALLPDSHRGADMKKNIGDYLNLLEPGMPMRTVEKIIPASIFTERMYGSYMEFSPVNRYESHSEVFCQRFTRINPMHILKCGITIQKEHTQLCFFLMSKCDCALCRIGRSQGNLKRCRSINGRRNGSITRLVRGCCETRRLVPVNDVYCWFSLRFHVSGRVWYTASFVEPNCKA